MKETAFSRLTDIRRGPTPYYGRRVRLLARRARAELRDMRWFDARCEREELAVTLDRAAGTARVGGRVYRVEPFGLGHLDVSTRDTWIGEVRADGTVRWTPDGGRTSQRRRRWDVLAAVARAWRASAGDAAR
jgi:hypothetical protein